ncbi:DUF4865 family protein [Marinobacterium sp. D7]|nr:DUF4865 family protein [Marinobacterium ramblicola]MBV1788540.1 DUF4865 family protein [Marinobacterium ramblicola]
MIAMQYRFGLPADNVQHGIDDRGALVQNITGPVMQREAKACAIKSDLSR